MALLLTLGTIHAALAEPVAHIAFGQDGGYTRIVLQLSEAPRDLEIEDPKGRPMTISFSGHLSGEKKKLQHFNSPNLSQVYYEERNGKVQVFIKRHVVGSAVVEADGQRLIIKVPHQTFRMGPNNEIASGIRYTRLVERTAAGPAVINVLEVDPRNPNVEVLPALASNRMGAKNNVANIVMNHQAVAGINGSFFKQDKGIPLGILIINQELVSGPIYDRVALGITNTNELVMDRVRLGGDVALPDGRQLRLHNINQPRVNPHHTVVYSSRWGHVAPKVPVGGLQVQLRKGRVTALSRQEPLPIPMDGVVISGPSTSELEALAALANQDVPVELSIYTLPDWSQMKHAIGGGPYLVRRGRPYVDLAAQHFTSKSLGYREPRSAVGITPDGKLLLVTVDGRQSHSVGMTLHELALTMQRLGAVEAMNLDGGSSTQMAIQGRIINNPSAGRVGVSNSLLVRITDGDNVALQNP